MDTGDEELAEQFVEEDVQGHSAEIFDVLCQYVGGEARARSKLYQKYSPKTMARAIRVVGQVTNLPKAIELRDVK